MNETTEGPGERTPARLRTLGLAALLAAMVVAVALPAGGDARHAKKLGNTGTSPKPACPQDDSTPPIKHQCQQIGSVTGFQVKADGKKGIFRARENGKLVAWSIRQSKPNRHQRNFFGDLWKTNRFGKHPSARISVLRPVHGKHKYKLIRQSPAVDLAHFFGATEYITLDKPLKIRKGQILALTLPTWAATLVNFIPHRKNVWRASRAHKLCPGTIPNAKKSRPHQNVGSIRRYGCDYTGARLDYWGYYVPKK